MKILLTIILTCFVILSSLIALAGTLCALGTKTGLVDRGSFALTALIALACDIGAILLIGKINRSDD